MSSDCTVACYYFPNYHVDPRNEKQHGTGLDRVGAGRGAQSRAFPEHRQPRVPLVGLPGRVRPGVMARKIDAAADHGIDAFIFDWYWYDDGPFLERGLERGFLQAPNNERLQFALMWANHDWLDIHPAKQNTPAHAALSRRGHARDLRADHRLRHRALLHATRPTGRSTASRTSRSTRLCRLVESFGGLDETRARARALPRQDPGGRLSRTCTSTPWSGACSCCRARQALPRPERDRCVPGPRQRHLVRLGAPRAAGGLPASPTIARSWRSGLRQWRRLEREFPLPYYPERHDGLGSQPAHRAVRPLRQHRLPVHARSLAATRRRPSSEALLRGAKTFLDARPRAAHRYLNAWNEWTEGSYLEPDTEHGLAYLEAIQRVFG